MSTEGMYSGQLRGSPPHSLAVFAAAVPKSISVSWKKSFADIDCARFITYVCLISFWNHAIPLTPLATSSACAEYLYAPALACGETRLRILNSTLTLSTSILQEMFDENTLVRSYQSLSTNIDQSSTHH